MTTRHESPNRSAATVEHYYPAFFELLAAQGRSLPHYVRREFEQYPKCGRLEYGFMRVRCELCHHEKLVAFSCKRRGFCASCGGRRMAESAVLLIDQVLPPLSLRQWVLTFPIPLRLLCATDARALSEILRIVYRCLSGHSISTAHLDKHRARTGAVTFIQRFGGSVNLNIHFHILALDGVYRLEPTPRPFCIFAPSKTILRVCVAASACETVARIRVSQFSVTRRCRNRRWERCVLERIARSQMRGRTFVPGQ